MPASKTRRPVRVALQGGGALGAFSAGVLDTLLASRRIELTHFSGTSAGAINAVVCASALATGGRRNARVALSSFWDALASSPLDDYLGVLWGPLGESLLKGVGEWLWNSAAAMPQLLGNLLPSIHATPLRTALESHVDFEALRAPGAPQVFITVTNVRTGLPRVIGNAELTLDAILASACLPQVFRAVELDGHSFWDGGFSGNPSLWPLIKAGGPTDILLIQLLPQAARELPFAPAEVQQRMAEIVFQSSLVAEFQSIHAVRGLTGSRGWEIGSQIKAGEDVNPLAQARFHRVGPPPDELLGSRASGDRSAKNLRSLWASGRSHARRFLVRDGEQIGLRDTLDLEAFIDGREPRLAAPAVTAVLPGRQARVQPATASRTRRTASSSALSIGGS